MIVMHQIRVSQLSAVSQALSDVVSNISTTPIEDGQPPSPQAGESYAQQHKIYKEYIDVWFSGYIDISTTFEDCICLVLIGVVLKFKYSYSETNPSVEPIGYREPPRFSPFGPGQLDRKWTGTYALAEEAGYEIIDVLPWDEWWNFELTKDESNPHISLLPLHPDVRAKFNETVAWEYALSMVGKPYGYHNLIFSWIDTIDGNYPPPLDAHVVASVMTVWNNVQPDYAANMWNEALNKRLGTKLKDAYTLKLFENNSSRLPKWCKDADTVKLPFCQIRGKYRMELPGYNTMDPYPDMNERCPSLPPKYSRPKGC
ncbi:hypothetical protein TEA_027835 [Camellia sinensis var. sinensis]|uniref:Uncharacterized protein n=1 Tax=Camellia sinensis var. sinensis TaxID=542762 RepID=A0A4S4D231_CAMSN|nr:hypothetical protein TEA_027835 [Camellia sinensis var. sinensis]